MNIQKILESLDKKEIETLRQFLNTDVQPIQKFEIPKNELTPILKLIKELCSYKGVSYANGYKISLPVYLETRIWIGFNKGKVYFTERSLRDAEYEDSEYTKTHLSQVKEMYPEFWDQMALVQIKFDEIKSSITALAKKYKTTKSKILELINDTNDFYYDEWDNLEHEI